MSRPSYIPALRFHALTALYDPIAALTVREATFKASLVAQVAPVPGARVLDVGCGTGTLAHRMKAACPGADVTGLDADPVMLARARTKNPATGSDIRFVEAMADQLPFDEGSFDKVTSSLFFHHLGDDAKLRVLREIVRVLVPGGELHVADWGRARGPLMRLAYYGIQLLDGFGSTQANVEGQLPTMMQAAGFVEVRETTTFSTLFGTLSLYRAIRPTSHVLIQAGTVGSAP